MNKGTLKLDSANIRDMLDFGTVKELRDDYLEGWTTSEAEMKTAIGITVKLNRFGKMFFPNDNGMIVHIMLGNRRYCFFTTQELYPDCPEFDEEDVLYGPDGPDDEVEDVLYDETNLAFMDALAIGYHIGARNEGDHQISRFGTRKDLTTYRVLFPLKV